MIFALGIAGCYSPQLGNPGYFCHEKDNPACPDGQKCVNGRCTSGPVTGGGNDLAMRLDGGGGGSDFATGGSHDFAMSGSHDLAMPPQPDFSMSGLCMCTNACSLTCVGPNCCLEQTFFPPPIGCTADPTCTPH